MREKLIKWLEADTDKYSYEKRRKQRQILNELRWDDLVVDFENLKISCEDSWGGEGEGDSYGIVLKVLSGDVVSYWSIPGWYNSEEGGEYNPEDMSEAEPYEKVVRDWRSK